ncbi:MAG: carotenoid biosynthesis protein, partial [Synechococcaceae cyanobacterium]|nr:carotenoid biosynthesis protein [Synechococcaceae cyanobacterium]
MADNNTTENNDKLVLGACWVLGVAWAVTRLTLSAYQNPTLGLLSVLLLTSLILTHGYILYGLKGILIYTLIGTAAGFSLEALSISSGFPFGLFVHHETGPKPLGVPIQAITAYAQLGWFAWVLAKLIVLERPWCPQPLSRWAVPPVAALILAGCDLPIDPIGATVQQQWTYAHPSGQFGVPLTNFLGWIFTGWVIFQLFAVVEQRFPSSAAATEKQFWLLPIMVWLLMAADAPIGLLRVSPGSVSVGVRTFITADIYEAAIITSLFTHGAISVIALTRLF